MEKSGLKIGSTEIEVQRYQSRYQRYCSKSDFVITTSISVKNIIISRYLDFRIEKMENRGTHCVESKRAHSQPGIYFVKIVIIENVIE